MVTPDSSRTRSLHDALPIFHVLRGASFSLRAAEMASLVGPSGVGKSTFLHVVGTLDPRTAGNVLYDGQDARSEEHTSELQSLRHIVCRLLVEKNDNVLVTAV